MALNQEYNGATSFAVPSSAAEAAPTASAGRERDGCERESLHGLFLSVHVYGSALFYSVLAVFTFFSLLNIRSQISSRPFMATINGFLCLLGASRAVSLFIDPYDLSHTMPKAMGAILWDVGFPCVLSAFCLIQLAFLEFTQLSVGPQNLRRKSFISVIITMHFSLVIGSDIAVVFHDELMPVKLVTQTIFVIWGIVLCSTVLYGGIRLRRLMRSVPGGLLNACGAQQKGSGTGLVQLALLAPYSNLASSVAAALVPALLNPRLRTTSTEQDHTTSGGEGCSTAVSIHAESLSDKACGAGASTSHYSRSPAASRRGTWGPSQAQGVSVVPSEDLIRNPSGPQTDYSLHTVLNHIALVSRAAATDEMSGFNRKGQVRQVLAVTSVTAVLGLLLCGAESSLLVGLVASPCTLRALTAPWVAVRTCCRVLELIMGWTMAAITKRPAVRGPQAFPPTAADISRSKPKPTLHM